MSSRLEAEFDQAMRDIYHRALSECCYRATRFLQLVGERGGVAAAKQLLRSPGLPQGLTKLWELGRLDLSMEALILQDRWAGLFTEEEIAVARKRLQDLGFRP